jgi:hypothetical protein
MRHSILHLLGVLLCAATWNGCENQPTQTNNEVDVATPQFSAKKGLLIPESTRQTLGLKTVEVIEQSMPSTLKLTLRVFQLGESNHVLASTALSLKETKQLQRNQRVEVLDETDGRGTGFVAAVHTELERSTGMSEAIVEVSNAPAKWTVGTFLQGNISLQSAVPVPTIPHSALLECSDGHSVYTVSGEHLVRTRVKIGATTEGFVEIKDGLYPGDQVVLQPVMSLWLTELAAVKGGQACCVELKKGK